MVDFDRWLTAHDREVAAKALREAAEEIDRFDFGPGQEIPFSRPAAHKWGTKQAAQRLRERAERIEAGEAT